MKKLIVIAALCFLSACNMNQRGAEDAVRESLKDPESGRFGEFYYNSTTKKGCLVVNAKNSMGGYTGDQMAFVTKTEKGWHAGAIIELPLESCRKIHADKAE